MLSVPFSLVLLSLLLQTSTPLNLPSPSSTRRAFVTSATASLSVAPFLAPFAASADEPDTSASPPTRRAQPLPTEETPLVTTRQGGLLEKYQSTTGAGWKMMAPSNWNKFDGVSTR